MPKTRQKSRWTGGKPPGTRTQKKKQAQGQSVEQLQAEITAKFDLAEKLLMKRPRPPFLLNSPHGYPPLEQAKNGFDKLLWELEKHMNPDGLRMDEPSKADAWLDATFNDAPGTVPRWSRRGQFILWFDYLPLLVRWNGILQPDTMLFAVDPTQPFVRAPDMNNRKPSEIDKSRQLSSAGHLSLVTWFSIAPKYNSVLDMVQHMIADISDKLLLRPLTKEAQQNVGDTLATEPWIVEALKRGPEHRMPMPRHLAAIQMPLFG